MAKEFIVSGNVGGYYNDDGQFIVCEEYGSEQDFGLHDVDVMNGNGFYNSSGKYIAFIEGDKKGESYFYGG